MTEEEIRADERHRILNTPELRNFADGVVLEAQHQWLRWGRPHDEVKAPWDWHWLLCTLCGKAVAAVLAGNVDKALHHTITAAAALANWHRLISETNPAPVDPRKPAGETMMADPYTDEELARVRWLASTGGPSGNPERLLATLDARDAAHRQEIAERDARIAELEEAVVQWRDEANELRSHPRIVK